MPRMNFSSIYTRVEDLSNVRNQRALIKDAIQMGLDRATAHDLPYLMTDGRIASVVEYTDGTVDVTEGSISVTSTGATFTEHMIGRKLRVNDDNTYYRIADVPTSATLTLETPYRGDDATAQTYSIYQDTYRLPADCDTYKIMRQIENKVALISVEASAFDLIEPVPTSEGTPNYEILAGTALDIYTDGTVAGTVGESTITGVSTNWLSVDGLSRGNRITIGAYVYTIKSVDSDTSITIYENLSVTFSAGTSYSILMDNLRIQFFEITVAVKNIYFRYQRIPYPLIDDVDIPDLPDQWHWILIYAGLIWAWKTKDKNESIRSEALFETVINQMWARIGHISVNRRYPRASQDDISARRDFIGPRYPAGYGHPFSF